MSNQNNNCSSRGGLGFLSVLQIIFIVLKCLNLITWSWWAVLIPLWISLGLIILIAIMFIIGYYIQNKLLVIIYKIISTQIKRGKIK